VRFGRAPPASPPSPESNCFPRTCGRLPSSELSSLGLAGPGVPDDDSGEDGRLEKTLSPLDRPTLPLLVPIPRGLGARRISAH